MTILRAEERIASLLAKPEVREAMAIRCEEERHDRSPGVTAFFQFVHVCKWCGARTP